MTVEFDVAFTSRAEWMSWAGQNPWVFDPGVLAEIAERIVAHGFTEPLSGQTVTGAEIAGPVGNLREGLMARGLNSRMRAVLALVERQLSGKQDLEVAIYAPEAVTGVANRLRSRFARFIGSEYLPDPALEREFFPIPHQDLTALTFPSDVFDVVTTNEVLEHVAGLDLALRELCRVLRHGGWHIGTVPFRSTEADSDHRARIEDGRIVHMKPPEYHGNPIDAGAGSLVFETPGWDLVARALAAGFSHAEMRFSASEQAGYITENTGVFVFCARK